MTSDRWTEEQLDELADRIKKEYKSAYKEVKQTASDYFASLQDRFDKEEEAWKAGKYTDDEFEAWKLNQIARGERWEAARDDLAHRITEANQAAAAYINDTTPGIYALNHNYEAYKIDQAEPISWTLYDENTVKRLMYDENHSEFRTVSINPKRDYKWNTQQIQSALTSGILQGKTPGQMADAFLNVMGRNQTAAMRNARTAVTSAQNGGRQDCYEKAEAAGIEIKKEWVATLDDRTRDSHAEMDGEQVGIDEQFSNGLMYPGDSSGEPCEVYNCRCTTRAILPGITDEPRMTYNDWLEQKKEEAREKYKTENEEEQKVTPQEAKAKVDELDSTSYKWQWETRPVQEGDEENKDIQAVNPIFDKDGDSDAKSDLEFALLDYEDEEIKEIATEKIVNVDDLDSFQIFVDRDGVKNYIDKIYNGENTTSTNGTGEIVVAKWDGKLYVVDGNHRAAASKLLGIDKIKVLYFEPEFRD